MDNFMIFDMVRYAGTQINDLKKNNVGEILIKVPGEDAYVVDFGSDAYVVAAKNLRKHTFSDKEPGPTVERRNRKWDTNEEK